MSQLERPPAPIRRAAPLLAAVVVATLLLAARAEAFIYWANGGTGSIGRSDIAGGGTTQSFITEAVLPCGVAVDDEFIYWANMDTGTIARADLDGSNPDQNFITGADGPCGVAVDDDFIYWGNYGESDFNPPNGTTIGRANLDGTGAEQSFITGAKAPGAVAVDDEFIYWANWNGNTIGRANLDGSSPNHSFISSSHASQPFGVAVNDTNIYWTNWSIAPTGTIGRAEIDGSDPNQNFITGANFPCGVAVDDSFVYWGNDQLVGIGRATLEGTGVDQSFVEGSNYPCGVAVNADAPEASASPTSVDFPDQLVDSPLTTQTITVTNSTGTTAPLTIGNASITGPNAEDAFVIGVDNCSTETLDPGESCTIDVGFSPESLGGKSAALSIPSNDPDSPTTVPLSGTGTDPEQTVAPTSIPFGGQLVGTSSPAETVTLANEPGATADDEIGDATILGAAGQFSIVTDECSGTTLPEGASCEITLDFGPTSTGGKQASLSIPSDAPDISPATVALSGTGTTPDEFVSPTAIQFGSQEVAARGPTRTITVENSADASASLAVGQVSLGGTGASQFDVAFDNCSGRSLSPGGECHLGIRFAPTTPGAASASVRIPSNGSATPVSVSLGGTATRQPPSNQFSLGKAKRNRKKGTAKLFVEVPGPGVLDLAGSKVKPATEETADAGAVSLPVKPKGAARRRLGRKGKAKVGLDVTFTPTGGDPNTEGTQVKLLKKHRRR